MERRPAEDTEAIDRLDSSLKRSGRKIRPREKEGRGDMQAMDTSCRVLSIFGLSVAACTCMCVPPSMARNIGCVESLNCTTHSVYSLGLRSPYFSATPDLCCSFSVLSVFLLPLHRRYCVQPHAHTPKRARTDSVEKHSEGAGAVLLRREPKGQVGASCKGGWARPSA